MNRSDIFFFYLSAQFHCLLLPSFHTRTEFKLSSLLLHLMLFVLHFKIFLLLLLHFTSRSELLQGAKHQGAAAGSCYTKSCRRLSGVGVGGWGWRWGGTQTSPRGCRLESPVAHCCCQSSKTSNFAVFGCQRLLGCIANLRWPLVTEEAMHLLLGSDCFHCTITRFHFSSD